MIRITRRAWQEKNYWVIWKPKHWSHPVFARVGGTVRCRKAKLLYHFRWRIGVFVYNPFKSHWLE